MDLMIVESPNKVKAITKYLGNRNIKVIGCLGHVTALNTEMKNAGAVDTEHGFKMHFVLNPKNSKNTKEIIRLAKNANIIYIATDPDRSGAHIGYHLQDLISKSCKGKEFRRVTYTEITNRAINNAIDNYSTLNMSEVESDFARAALDYLVGFHVSPILWKRLYPGLSAGRVQSPALRMLAQREIEIKNFKPTLYWQILIDTEKDNIQFPVRLVSIKGEKVAKDSLTDKSYVEEHKSILENLVKKEKLVVSNIKSSKASRKPKAPYSTSTLQMDGVRKLGWSTKRVMDTAQKLFEGSGDHGYITYHRTDSVNLAEDALMEIHSYAKTNYAKFAEDQPKRYQSKNKSAQEAHEAIRPTQISLTPDSLSSKLSSDEKKLYEMIWQRTLASQMKPALFDNTSVDFHLSNDYTFRANGSVLVFQGYLCIFQDAKEIDGKEDDDVDLPKLLQGDKLTPLNLQCNEHETKPPARFNEASLVKALEEYGIGRPSTYATIPKTLNDRGYVTIEKNRFTVTDVGLEVADYLSRHFTEYVDYGFTANLETQLDNIASGKENWVAVMYQFWKPFKALVDKEKAEAKGGGIIEESTELCSKCGGKTVVKLGRYGKYLDCISCGNKTSLSTKEKKEKEYLDFPCKKCGGKMVKISGFKGRFFAGCENYHGKEKGSCDYKCNIDGTEIEKKPDAISTGVKCDQCKKNDLVVKTGRFGKMVACSGFPKCRRIVKKEEYESVLGKNLDKVLKLLSE